jgi:hypothetical protein
LDTIFAALISGGWATVIAGMGFWFSRVSLRSTERSALNTLDADHAARLWDKRAEAYVDTLWAQAVRRDVRDMTIQKTFAHLRDQRGIRKEAAEMQVPDLRDIESRLLAYASQEVLGAFHDVNESERAFFGALDLPASNPRREQEVIDAAVAATETDMRLWDAVQADLNRKPSEWADRGPVGFNEVRVGPVEVTWDDKPL